LSKKIGDYLGLELSVVRAKRLDYNECTRAMSIAVELSTIKQKVALMRNTNIQNLSTDCFVENGEKKRIYINDHLTDFYHGLLGKTREFAEQNGFVYVWYSNCQIYLKKNSSSTIYLIGSEADFQVIDVSNE